ncbi:DUF202 domain-containing protein [Kitasatospora sp. NPDC006697]|uniref:DUF202 domain-containing protein n=1 Tax=Kitasatospora sp. NPDC006697 TaxID=3364020 RepID=UPI00368D93C1
MSGAPAAPPHDPGLQAERTLLAWSRTALVLAVNAALVLRTALSHHELPLAVLGSVLALSACGMWVFGLARRRRLLPGPPRAVGALPLRLVSGTVALAAASGAWAVLLHHLPRR